MLFIILHSTLFGRQQPIRLIGVLRCRLGTWRPPLQPVHRVPDLALYVRHSVPDCPSMVGEVAVEQSLSSLLRDQDAYSVNPDIKMFLGIKVWRKQTEFSALVSDMAKNCYSLLLLIVLASSLLETWQKHALATPTRPCYQPSRIDCLHSHVT